MRRSRRDLLPSSSIDFTSFLVTAMILCSIVSCSTAAQTQVRSQTVGAALDTALFPPCIDDGDCAVLGQGDKYACFKFFCYPWKDDSGIDPKKRMKTCRKKSDCSDPDHRCVRHQDRRNIGRGLCFNQVDCGDHDECPRGQKCCGNSCCDESHFNQYRLLPCVSNFGCEDYGLGQYCCNGKNSTKVCCDVNPDPPTTMQPYTASSATGSSDPSLKVMLLQVLCLGSIPFVTFNANSLK